MTRKLNRSLIAVGVFAATVGVGVGLTMAGGQKSTNPKDWVDAKTGRYIEGAVPDRLKFSTVLADQGYGWIESAVIVGDDFVDPKVPVPIYADESGDEIIGYFIPGTGVTLDKDHQEVSKDASPVSVAADSDEQP